MIAGSIGRDTAGHGSSIQPNVHRMEQLKLTKENRQQRTCCMGMRAEFALRKMAALPPTSRSSAALSSLVEYVPPITSSGRRPALLLRAWQPSVSDFPQASHAREKQAADVA